MNELIWVGNTLLPRWMVFAGLGLSVTAASAVAVFAIQGFVARMTYINNRD